MVISIIDHGSALVALIDVKHKGSLPDGASWCAVSAVSPAEPRDPSLDI
jgi:hypothetical protein